MTIYYCRDCAKHKDMLGAPPIKEDLTDNKYKLDKYVKHTVSSSHGSYRTVFCGVASESYQHNVFTAVASGHVQVDRFDRVNMVWIASGTTGFAVQGGRYVCSLGAVKAVCHWDARKVHGFPIHSAEIESATCARCGRSITC